MLVSHATAPGPRVLCWVLEGGLRVIALLGAPCRHQQATEDPVLLFQLPHLQAQVLFEKEQLLMPIHVTLYVLYHKVS